MKRLAVEAVSSLGEGVEGVKITFVKLNRATTAATIVGAVSALLAVGISTASAAGDANQEVCPQAVEASPGFRSYLPDCRAYEMVTPQFKDGAPFSQGYTEVSPDGSKMISQSLGVLAGTGSDQFLQNQISAAYELTRSSSGWRVSSLEPLLNEFGKTEIASVSSSLDRTAWLAEQLSEPQLLIREPEGKFIDVGPTIPRGSGEDQPKLVGADGSLNLLLLSVLANGPGKLWNGDITAVGRRSLYAYTDTPQHEPLMVAVKNEGRLQANADAEPITACGSELGAGESGTGYNAISDEGDVIFFTVREAGCGSLPAPKVNELYARVNGEKTLDISEPPLTGSESIPGRECTGICATDEESTPSSAIYQGASSDGTQVFFTTTQPLINSAVGGGRYLYEETIAREGLHSHVTSLNLVGNGGVAGVVRSAADGSLVYFVSTNVLAGNLNSVGKLNSEEQKAVEGEDNLYAYNTSQSKVVYIATLANSDSEDWKGSDAGRTAQASLPDGRFLVFISHHRLTQDNQSAEGVGQLFEYDAQVGEYGQLNRVSTGYQDGGAVSEEGEAPKIGRQNFEASGTGPASQALARSQRLSVTEAGTVFFQSKAKLTPLALPRFNNVYEYHDGGVYLISDGQDTAMLPDEEEPESVVQLISTTSSGQDVFFQTADSLVPQDGDTQLDYYDARVEGGFPAPPTAIQCGEDCQGSESSSPTLLSPTSASYSGGTNLPPPMAIKTVRKKKATKCSAHKKLSGGKCVKIKKKTKARKIAKIRKASNYQGGKI
jgi:hypothetical protein